MNCSVEITFSTSIHFSIEMHMQLVAHKAVDDNSYIFSDSSHKLDFDKIDYAGFARELVFTNWSTVFNVNDSMKLPGTNLVVF